VKKGHVVKTNLKCRNEDKPHIFSWSSSPYLPSKEYLVNSRVNHGLICSGIFPSDYKRFANGAGIGIISEENRTTFFKQHKQHIQQECNDSIETALLEEVASYEDLETIDIMTDARHGWRKNAEDTSVVAIGEKTHKVLKCEHVAKTDDLVTQKNEKIGTERIYSYMDEHDSKIGIHCHDRNLFINKFIRESTNSVNQIDTWHCVKAMKTSLTTISSGTLRDKGKTWSFQLTDKVEPVATHVHWCIRNCDNEKDELRSSLLNIVDHYKNIHTSCHESSRCRKDKNYESSRVVITEPLAESFNNVINVYQNKRIAFGDEQYNTRNNLAVCHWNENVDREYTSVSNPQNARRPRSKRGKKNYKKLSFKFRDNTWKRFVNSVFRKRNKRKNN
jgi:hypothetical protein